MSYIVTELKQNMWMIRDAHVNMYLFDGMDHAILIDTGFGQGNIRKLVDSIVNKPVEVILTHGHGDHVGGASQFECLYGHPLDFSLYDRDVSLQKRKILKPVSDNDYIYNGYFKFRIIHTPGHTNGSISLLEENRRMMFVGDNMSYTPVYMCLPDSSMDKFEHSLRVTKDLCKAQDVLYANHSVEPIPWEMLDEFIEFCDLYKENRIERQPAVYFGKYPCGLYMHKRASALIL